jgi:aryl-alcohol dehydrogenase-like predicted oxidoreductase
MQTFAIQHNLTPFISLQNHMNLLYREEEREMMPTLAYFGVGSIPWSPLCRGLLSRPWKAGSTREENDPWAIIYTGLGESSEKIVQAVEKVAKAHGATMAQVSLAWLLAKDGVSAPIVGTTKLKNLYDLQGESFNRSALTLSWLTSSPGALDLKLSAEEIKELEEHYRPQDVLGHW